MNEQQYKMGFNHGYLLAKHLPGVLAQLVKGLNATTEYLSGFFSGKEEWELEKAQLQLTELDQIRTKNKDQSRER